MAQDNSSGKSISQILIPEISPIFCMCLTCITLVYHCTYYYLLTITDDEGVNLFSTPKGKRTKPQRCEYIPKVVENS